jgi:hypothetical protein
VPRYISAMVHTNAVLIVEQERERAVDASGSEAQYAELIEKINQLNILRGKQCDAPFRL